MTPRPCTAAAALGVIGEKWSLLVVRELAFGVHRFDSIVQNTGAPRDILTNRLRQPRERGRRREAAVQRAPAPLRVSPDAGGTRAEADSPEPRPVGQPLGRRRTDRAGFEHTCGETLELVHTCKACGEAVTGGRDVKREQRTAAA